MFRLVALAASVGLAGAIPGRGPGCAGKDGHEECSSDPTCAWNENRFQCHDIDKTFANGTPCNMVSEEDECAHRSECKWHDDVEACTHTDEHPPCDKANSRRECQALKCDWHKPTNTGSQGMCVTPGEKIDCGSFHAETECDTSRNALDHCEWLEHSHICQDKGTPVDCQSLYTEDACRRASHCKYDTKDGTCTGEHDVHTCEHIYEATDCKAVAHCEYLDDVQLCHRAGLKVGCFRLHQEAMCAGQHGAEHCEWAEERGTCQVKGTTLPCDYHSEKELCNKADHCEYDVLAEFCKMKGMKTACKRFYEESACSKQQDCAWHDHACLSQHAAQQTCEDLTGQRKCGNRGNCAWDDRNHKCHRAEQGDSDHFDPHAALGGSITTCKGKVDSEKCNSKYEGKCLDDDWGDLVQVACPIMCNTCDPNDVKHGEDADVTKDPEHPDFSQGGEYHGTAHEDTHGGTADTDEGSPIDCTGVKCEGVAPTECPEGEHLGKPKKECCPKCGYTDKVCNTFHERNTCPDKCEWHGSQYYCGGMGVSIPCSKLFTENQCLNKDFRDGQCDWHGSVDTCTPKGEVVPCDNHHEEETCPSPRCNWHGSVHQCFEKDAKVPCDRFYEEANCDLSYCDYDAPANACHKKGEQLPCSQYYSGEGCDGHKDRCAWLPRSSRCIVRGEDLPCETHGVDDCGAFPGCGWDAHLETCAVQYDFVPLECSLHDDALTCTTEKDCSYDTISNVCHKTGERPKCELYSDEDGCKGTKHCNWHPDALVCHEPSQLPKCNSYYSEESCKDDCEWDSQLYRCKERGEITPCDDHYEQDTCTASGCNWNSDVYHCSSTGDKIPCNKYHEQPMCEEREDCTFMKQSHRCLGKGETLSCEEYTVKAECEGTEHCEFWTNPADNMHIVVADGTELPDTGLPGMAAVDSNLGHCVKKASSKCALVSEEEYCNPKTIPGCGWDHRGSRCRAIRVNDEL